MPILPAFPTVFRPRTDVRTLFFVLLLVVWAAALPAHANNLSEANQLFKAGEHAKALEQVNRHLDSKPQDAQGRFLKGLILTGLNKPNDAIVIFKKLTEDYPELPEPYNNLAVIYAQQKQYDKAKEALEKAIRTHPAYATAHENLGDIYSRLASQAYGKALQIDSSNASAQTKLAMINELVGSAKVGAGKTADAQPVPAPAPRPAVVPPTPVVIASTAKPAEAPKPPAPAAAKVPEPKPVEAKPAEVKPAPVETKPAPALAKPTEPTKTAAPESDITAAIDGWLAAWSKKDVKGYLAHYAKDFQTPDGEPRKEWETERAQRVGKPGKIEVTRDKLSIKLDGDDKAVVRFRQNYRSSGFKSSSGKTLTLIRHEGKWLIQQERVGG
jgi:Tfp pilus assembly protein PilF/ketosteroid isomerase-like protein